MNDHPRVIFVPEALVAGGGWGEVNLLLIREADGRYRVADGPDLRWVHEKAPMFLGQTLDEGRCNACGKKLTSGS